MAYWTGPVVMSANLYPNLDSYTTEEMTNPETTEMDHYTAGPATASIETPNGVLIPAKRMDALKFAGVIAVVILVMWLLGKA